MKLELKKTIDSATEVEQDEPALIPSKNFDQSFEKNKLEKENEDEIKINSYIDDEKVVTKMHL